MSNEFEENYNNCLTIKKGTKLYHASRFPIIIDNIFLDGSSFSLFSFHPHDCDCQTKYIMTIILKTDIKLFFDIELRNKRYIPRFNIAIRNFNFSYYEKLKNNYDGIITICYARCLIEIHLFNDRKLYEIINIENLILDWKNQNACIVKIWSIRYPIDIKENTLSLCLNQKNYEEDFNKYKNRNLPMNKTLDYIIKYSTITYYDTSDITDKKNCSNEINKSFQ